MLSISTKTKTKTKTNYPLKVCASERDASSLTITPRAQPKLNNEVVNTTHYTLNPKQI